VTGLNDRPVVLLHGCGGSVVSTFAEPGWLNALADRGRMAMAPDLPGHGASAASRNPADYADLAGLILPQLPQGPFDGIGFSLGSKLLLAITLRCAGRVQRLVLGGIGDNVFAEERVAAAAARALEHGAGPDTPAPVLDFLRTWEPQRNDPLAVAAVLRRPPNPVFSPDDLRHVCCPVLIVNGELDAVNQMGNRLESGLCNAHKRILPGVGHFDLPGRREFMREAIEFLCADAASANSRGDTAAGSRA
jgi:pimeloyl-ACP methyl ester carboxylesterase